MVLTFLGLFLSVLWLGLCGWYVERTIGFDQLLWLMPNELGQVLSGMFLPVAFLWVLLAYANLAGRVRALERGEAAALRDVQEHLPRSEPSVGRRLPEGYGDDDAVPRLTIAGER